MALTESDKAAQKKYRNSDKYTCEEAKERRRKGNRKYDESEKGKEVRQTYAKTKKHKDSVVASRRKKKFGISAEDFDKMLLEQENKCKSCGDTLVSGRFTHLDHCHDTGNIRGILCHHCNLALGHMRESAIKVLGLLNYIGRYC